MLGRDHRFERTMDDVWAAIERGNLEEAKVLVLALPRPRQREAARELLGRRDNRPTGPLPRDPEIVLDLFNQTHREALARITAYAQGAPAES